MNLPTILVMCILLKFSHIWCLLVFASAFLLFVLYTLNVCLFVFVIPLLFAWVSSLKFVIAPLACSGKDNETFWELLVSFTDIKPTSIFLWKDMAHQNVFISLASGCKETSSSFTRLDLEGRKQTIISELLKIVWIWKFGWREAPVTSSHGSLFALMQIQQRYNNALNKSLGKHHYLEISIILKSLILVWITSSSQANILGFSNFFKTWSHT